MTLKNGIIFIWTGTHASIPSGWSRVTDMDDKFPKGTANATNPDTTGGNATHTHTATAVHTHTAAAHTHTITIAATSSTGTGSSGTKQPAVHSHTCPDAGAVNAFTCDSPASTYGAYSNNPPFYEVIYATPTTAVSTIPAGMVVLADAAPPAGFNICDGTNSTPNLVDKYLKGAAAAANAGTTGGSLTNTHTLSHVHVTSHGHAAVTSGNPSATAISNSGTGTVPAQPHTHSVALPAPGANNSTTNNVTLPVSAETVEPVYTKLLAIQAGTTVPPQIGIIGMYKGLLSTIPAGWILCDGSDGTIDMRDQHLKITGTIGHIGNTGGSNTHAHASQNHGHTLTAHTHSTSVNHVSSGQTVTSSGSATKGETGHSVSTSATSLVLNDAATSANSSSNEPLFRTVAFIKLQSITNPGAFMLNFIH